ncbi:pyridoxal phosphate-dependent aminotransferase [Thermoactinomyces mirandus]|uniref:Pyridoxal phosphate-dependent aminotransferase n=1 Tax=Thermoactinomyces mirandus TaxID=2756294 RepID=A0A7W1XPB6_9BACL|nr:pyridoxal phosphate-dependent aminotransferase [Thermoactinomyces mirandus]MBA4600804.1 pyridoxal phosphate-dependent aminotransferase [Thermoactinomyces mirandus]
MERFEIADALKRLPEQYFVKLTDKVNCARASGHDLINLGQGNPDQPTPPHIVRELQQAAEKAGFHKYPPFQGYRFVKEAVSRFYRREYGVEVDPDKEVAVLFGGKAGLVEISKCYLNPGDVALVPDPGYPDYWSGILMAGARMHMMPLKGENDFLPDYGQIDVSVWKKAKLMFLNYPNNPTGALAPASFFEETVRMAERYHVLIVHDFAYSSIGFDGEKPHSFLQTPGAKRVGVEIYTMSKTYNMAGWRIGFAIGHEDVIQAINLLQDHFYCSLFGAIQKAAAAALLGPQECVQDLVNMYERRRNVFISRLREIGWNVKAPRGSFFCWLKVPNGYSSESFSDLLLERAHVVVAPGIGFGKEGNRYVRAALLTSEERLQEAAKRIGGLGIF